MSFYTSAARCVSHRGSVAGKLTALPAAGTCLVVDAQAGDVHGPLHLPLRAPKVAPVRLHCHAQPCLHLACDML